MTYDPCGCSGTDFGGWFAQELTFGPAATVPEQPNPNKDDEDWGPDENTDASGDPPTPDSRQLELV